MYCRQNRYWWEELYQNYSIYDTRKQTCNKHLLFFLELNPTVDTPVKKKKLAYSKKGDERLQRKQQCANKCKDVQN